MKKKLTINTLALGNLTKHKKQYTIMIIGIILSMVFSSSVIISIFSLNASELEMGRNSIGTQDVIMLNVTEKGMKEAKNDGYIDEYGFAHMIGYASADAENIENGFYIAWLDDTAKRLSYQSFIEGAYPTQENEIAIEQTVLARLGIEAKIGDEISLDVFPQNGISHIKNSNQKTYKLVGIVKDKASGIERTTDGEFLRNIPSAFVCEGAKTDVGGKESLVSYLTFADFDYPEYYIDEDGIKIDNDEYSEFNKYINEKYDIPDDIEVTENQEFVMLHAAYRYAFQLNNESMEMLITFAGIIGVVLALASCIAIINSFNSNIKERRQQIGMLRAVGTTRRQIIKLLGREALIISLISIPISLVISYLFVLALSNVFGEGFVLTIDVKSIVVCGAVGLVTVMLAALIPIIHATRITPMQAIRNVDVARKMKIKKIKTQKNYSVPKLLAKRSMAFHKGNQVAVSILLVTTILFSCLGFSFVSHEFADTNDNTTVDYRIGIMSGSDEYTNIPNSNEGISDIDKQTICSTEYISESYGQKECRINILIDEYTDYYRMLARNVFDEHEDEMKEKM
ncbi:MAG: FtsX-like permease family protein, partial [Eubacterium sp.]|nr:FtsX-like permease family protein [Eubacterium sp.]